MKRFALILTAVLLALPGCLGSSKGTVPIRPPPPSPTPGPGAGPQDAWSIVGSALTVDESTHTKYVGPTEARECPKLKVSTAMEQEVELRPGQSGFAEPGSVTLVVFWQMELTEGRAAAQHVQDLVRKYGGYGARAVGVVERTAGAVDAVTFLTRQGIGYPVYYDTLGALKAMRKAARADDRLGKLVAIFIIDRKQRVRFYRGEFPYSESVGGAASAYGGIVRPNPDSDVIPTGQVRLTESAPEGHRIEDYLRMILNEPS
jgi:hypothetical protein